MSKSTSPQFKTEEECWTHIETLEKVGPHWFCPLINGSCNPKCVVYVPRKPKSIWNPQSRKEYVVEDHYCGNEMFER